MVIGIGGLSTSGKSGLAKRIQEYYSEKNVMILCQDNFVFPKSLLPRINDHIDWEHPLSIDFNKLHQKIITESSLADILIVEGILAFYDQQINLLLNKKILLEIPKKEFIARKTVDTRWGKEPLWYIEHIWNSYMKCGKIPYGWSDTYYISGAKDIDLARLIHYLENSS